MAIKKGLLCQDENLTQGVYPYTQTDCVFDEDTNLPQENINQSLAGSLATIETSPSTSAHSVGEYIVYNYQLYKVISAISAGANLVENTNIQATTLEIKNQLKYKDYTYTGTLPANTDASFNLLNIYPEQNVIVGYRFVGPAPWINNIFICSYYGNYYFLKFNNPSSVSVTFNFTMRVYYF